MTNTATTDEMVSLYKAMPNFQASLAEAMNAALSVRGKFKPLADDAGDQEQCYVDTHWWGFDIVMNEKLTDDIVNGTIAYGVLSSIVVASLAGASLLTGPVGAAIGGAFAVETL